VTAKFQLEKNEGGGMVALGFGKSLIMLEKLVVLNNPLSLSLNFFSFIPFLSNFSFPLLASL